MCRLLRILLPALVVVAVPVASRADAQAPPAPVAAGHDHAGDADDAIDVPGASTGAQAFVSLVLDGELDDVAAGVDWTAGELADTLLTDDSLFVTDIGDVGYADQAPGPSEFVTAEPPPARADASTIFTLHSLPAAPLTILLDFDGHVTTHTPWNRHRGDIESKPFDRDGRPSTLSPAEIAEMEAVWRIVAEDFAPFNVDVTTDDPGYEALEYSGKNDLEYGTRIVISPTDGWFAEGYGGVAYIGSFKSENTPAFVFSDNLGSFKSIGDASSHEAGHTLSLRHDGTSERTYYSGHGGWGPIMGTSYSRLLAQWSRGEYDDASNDEHDVTELAERLGRRLDDHGDTSPTATLLGGTGETAGFIGAEDPVDVFVVDVVAGEINARVTPASSVSNLFASVTIRDTAGVVVAEHIPTAVTTKAEPATRPIDWAASATAVVPDGRYTVEVRPGGLGTPSTGFSTYGSRGAYVLTVALGSGSPPPSSGHPGPGAAHTDRAGAPRRHTFRVRRDASTRCRRCAARGGRRDAGRASRRDRCGAERHGGRARHRWVPDGVPLHGDGTDDVDGELHCGSRHRQLDDRQPRRRWERVRLLVVGGERDRRHHRFGSRRAPPHACRRHSRVGSPTPAPVSEDRVVSRPAMS